MSDLSVSVWKFPLRDDAEAIVRMPRHARVLSVQLQDGLPQVWALVDPQEPVVRRKFWIVGTGWTFNPVGLGSFVDTIQVDGGLVFHVFDGGEIEAMPAPGKT